MVAEKIAPLVAYGIGRGMGVPAEEGAARRAATCGRDGWITAFGAL